MSMNPSSDSRRVMHLRAMYSGGSFEIKPMTRTSIDFLFEYIESLEAQLAQVPDIGADGPAAVTLSLAERDPYYRARAAAKFGVSVSK